MVQYSIDFFVAQDSRYQHETSLHGLEYVQQLMNQFESNYYTLLLSGRKPLHLQPSEQQVKTVTHVSQHTSL